LIRLRDLAVGEHVVVLVLPLAGRARELAALEDEVLNSLSPREAQ
jgi:hypothetical protein